MKKLFTLIITVVISICAFTQTPQKMSYQAVIRNAGGALLPNQNVGIRIQILQGSEYGAAVYVETHTGTTNANGLATLEIGGGTVVLGSFSGINWAGGPYFLKTEIDPAGGTSYSIIGTNQLLSVPYALYAKSVATETDPVFAVSPASGITGTNITNWNTAFGWGNHAGLYRPITWVPSWTDVTGKPTTFTPSAHPHSAADITSGTLDAARIPTLDIGTKTSGTLSAARGGTGQASLTAGKILVGNGTSAILVPANLHWDNTNSQLGIGTNSPSQRLDIVGQVRIRGGNPGTGKVLYSDANGVGSWQYDGLTLPYTGTASSGLYGFYIDHTQTTAQLGWAITGRAHHPGGRGVVGYAMDNGSTTNYGVYGQSYSESGTGVAGWASAASGTTYGASGRSSSTSGRGVYGWASATSGTNYGGYFETASTSGYGVFGKATATSGSNLGGWFVSASTSGYGVFGHATAISGQTGGVTGQTSSTIGYGVIGQALATSGSNIGVFGVSGSSDGYGVFCYGRFASSGSKAFQIDHPLEPENMFLNHYCTEGAEPLNVYSGNIILNSMGEAIVELPKYFEAINTNYRYQLTCIGGFAPVYIGQEIENNRFKISGGQSGMKISWRVEALRNDPWVKNSGVPVETEKPNEFKGKYLHPELYGKSKSMSIHSFFENQANEF